MELVVEISIGIRRVDLVLGQVLLCGFKLISEVAQLLILREQLLFRVSLRLFSLQYHLLLHVHFLLQIQYLDLLAVDFLLVDAFCSLLLINQLVSLVQFRAELCDCCLQLAQLFRPLMFLEPERLIFFSESSNFFLCLCIVCKPFAWCIFDLSLKHLNLVLLGHEELDYLVMNHLLLVLSLEKVSL